MFPLMNHDGMMGAIAHYVYDYINEGIALGFYRGHKTPGEHAKEDRKNALSKKEKKE